MEENDVVSLVQVQTSKHIKKSGGEHSPAQAEEDKSGTSFSAPLPGQALLKWPASDKMISSIGQKAHDAAIVDSMPNGIDHGVVNDAYHGGLAKTRDSIQAKAADRIAFTNSQRAKRKMDHQAAVDAIAADKQAVEAAIAKYHADVEEIKRQRKEIVSNDAEKIRKAKEDAEAHHIKALQAEHAAVLGRKAGMIEGSDAAQFAWKQYRKDVAEEKAAAVRATEKQALAKREALARAAVKKETQLLAEAEMVRVNAIKRKEKAIEAAAAAKAALREQSIIGAEGLRNRMTETKADWAVKRYDQLVDEDQAIIDAAAHGQWPPGDWPLGP